MASSNIEKRPSYLYFGGELICLKFNREIQHQRVTGENWLKGIRIGYDIIKPNAPYFGCHLATTFNQAKFHFKPQDDATLVAAKTRRGYSPLWNGEFRFGHTFFDREITSTFFFGLGFYKLDCSYAKFLADMKNLFFSKSLLYCTGGTLIFREFSPSLSIGCHFKVFWIFRSYDSFTYKFDKPYVEKATYYREIERNTDKTWGGEVGVPLAWRPLKAEILAIHFEPYYLRLATKKGTTVGYGTRLLLGIRF